MDSTRRIALLLLAASPLTANAQKPEPPLLHVPPPMDSGEDSRLPDGKSQKDAIAKQNHEEALKDLQDLVSTAQQLQVELRKAGQTT